MPQLQVSPSVAGLRVDRAISRFASSGGSVSLLSPSVAMEAREGIRALPRVVRLNPRESIRQQIFCAVARSRVKPALSIE